MKKLFFTFYLITSFCVGQSPLETQKFSSDELKQDLHFLFEKLESIHPALYHYTSALQMQKTRTRLEKDLDHSMTRLEFARKVIPVVSMLKDGHTSVAFPQEERTTFLKNGGKIFPFEVLIRNNKIFITANYTSDSTILKFSEILSINGSSSLEVLNKMRPYVSAELDIYIDVRLQQIFRRMLWYVIGWENDYEIQLNIDGEVATKKIQGITEKEFQEKNVDKLPTKPYTYYNLGNSIGVIDFRSMTYPKQFDTFLDSTFTIIHKNNIQYLVIDIRNNGGGNSQLGDALLNYITNKPYKQIDRMEVKNSIEAGQVKNKDSKKNGTITLVEDTPLKTPKNPSNKFNGKTYLLTSNFTYSSANMLANTFKCFTMGTIVGEETGGVLTAFGDLITSTLPNTKLQAWCSHKKFVHPCSDGTLHGVKPDVEIIPTPDDFRLGRDAALEYIKQIAQKQ